MNPDTLEKLIAEVAPIAARAGALVAQCREWSDQGVKGIDPGKVNVRGGSITDPTVAAALREGRDEWERLAERISDAARVVRDGLHPLPVVGSRDTCPIVWAWDASTDEERWPELFERAAVDWVAAWARAARDLIGAARRIDARWTETPREDTARLVDENSTSGDCEWCHRFCRGRCATDVDGRTVDDRRRRVVVSDRWTIGLCNACWMFLVRRWPEGQPMSDVSRLDEIRKERAANLAGRTTESEMA